MVGWQRQIPFKQIVENLGHMQGIIQRKTGVVPGRQFTRKAAGARARYEHSLRILCECSDLMENRIHDRCNILFRPSIPAPVTMEERNALIQRVLSG